MRCRTARHLLAIADAEPRTESHRLKLDAHLCACESCRAHHAALTRLNADLQAEAFAESRSVSDAFYGRLGVKLAAVNAERDAAHVAIIDRLITRTIQATLAPARAFVYTALAGAVLAAALLSPIAVFAPPRTLALNYNPRHLASLSVERAPDGRVYASLDASSAPARATATEALQ